MRRNDLPDRLSNHALSRRDFLRVAGLGTALPILLSACAPAAAPSSGGGAAAAAEATSIKALASDISYTQFVSELLPEFQEATGIEVELELLGWPVALQQTEIELSAGSGTYDVMQMIFIKAQRWMRPGWTTPLDDFAERDKDEVNIDDFLPATIDPFRWEGALHALPWVAESTQTIYRQDLLEESGLAFPETFDDLGAVCEAIHNPPDMSAYVVRTEPNGVHFPFPIWIQGYGGNIFADPPNDMTPTLNTAEALAAAQNFTDLITNYSAGGSQIWGVSECQNALAQEQAAIWVDALGIFGPILDPEKSKVSDKVSIGLVPGGPAGRFPQIATHGLQIPNGAANQEAGWEFIKWATSADVLRRSAIDGNHSAVPRGSILKSQEYADKYTMGGVAIGELVAEALDLSNVAYRVVPEFPEVGQRMGQGIGEIISGQKSVDDAMNDVQKDVVQIMLDGGYEISA